MTIESRHPSRTEVRSVPCPVCGARPGQKCRRKVRSPLRTVEREANHAERVDMYLWKSVEAKSKGPVG